MQSGEASAETIKSDGQRQPSADEILGCLQGEIEPVRTTTAYKLALCACSVVMVLLPLLYLALVAGLVYGLYLHATYDAWILTERGAASHQMRVRALAYFAPLIVGGFLLIFLLKPLSARSGKSMSGLALDPSRHPILFEYVNKLCAIIGAPAPREIKVDCDVNASASFRRGMLSLLGNDLTLTIGLPLAARLSLRELTGVLAHEMGHFAQGFGMRLTYVIRNVNFWFMRVVYERDKWDEWLESSARGSGHYIAFFVALTRGAIWLSRRVLWLLMMFGHVVCSYMLRQMEFDADQYEARTAGAAAFKRTCTALRELGVASQFAHHELSNLWQQRRLADNLPAMIIGRANSLPAEVRETIDIRAAAQKTGWFETHPADMDRIAGAQRVSGDGIVRGDYPARVLFSEFDSVCRTLTFIYYRDALGEEVDRENLVQTEKVDAEQEQNRSEGARLERYLGFGIPISRPFTFEMSLIPPPRDARVIVSELTTARRVMRAAAPRMKEALKAHAEADSARLEAEAWNVLIRTGAATRKDVPDATAARRRMNEALETIRPVEEALRDRLRAGLELLATPQLEKLLPGAAEYAREANRLLAVFGRLTLSLERLPELREQFAVISAVFSAAQRGAKSDSMWSAARSRLDSMRELVAGVRVDMDDIPYPFAYAGGTISLGKFLVRSSLTAADMGEVFTVAEQYLSNLGAVYFQALRRLVTIAAYVEDALEENARAKKSAAAPVSEESPAVNDES